MRFFLITLLCVISIVISACSSTPRAVSSQHYKAEAADFLWKRGNGSAPVFSHGQVTFILRRTSTSPSPLYLKVFLPNPDGSLSKPIQKIDSGGKGSSVVFSGPLKNGWVNNKRYNFYLETYSDPKYSKKIDSLSQPAICIAPHAP